MRITIDCEKAAPAQIEVLGRALREIKADRQLVSFDMRMVI